MCSRSPTCAMPALFTRMSTRPSRRSTSSNAARDRRRARHVARDRVRARADGRGHRPRRDRVAVQERHPRALPREEARDRLPDAGAGPRDDRGLAREIEHVRVILRRWPGSFHAEPAEIALLAHALQHPAEEERARRQVDGVRARTPSGACPPRTPSPASTARMPSKTCVDGRARASGCSHAGSTDTG